MRKFFKNNIHLLLNNYWHNAIIYLLILIIPLIIDIFISFFYDKYSYLLLITLCSILYILFGSIYKSLGFTKFSNNKMKISKLIYFMVLISFTQTAITYILFNPVNYLTNNFFGITIINEQGNVTEEDLNFLSILYIVFIGPLFEELIWRGFGISFLKKFGNEFAIIITSISFGLLHMSCPQSIDAALGGLIYGYVAIKYGLKYSIFLHCFNNFMAYVVYFMKIYLPPFSLDICCYISLIICIYIFFKYYIKDFKNNNILTPHYTIKQYLFCLFDPLTILHLIMFINSIIVNAK